MLALEGYYDGENIQALEEIHAQKNQKLIITILDEFVEEVPKAKSTQTVRGCWPSMQTQVCGAGKISVPANRFQNGVCLPAAFLHDIGIRYTKSVADGCCIVPEVMETEMLKRVQFSRHAAFADCTPDRTFIFINTGCI